MQPVDVAERPELWLSFFITVISSALNVKQVGLYNVRKTAGASQKQVRKNVE